MGAALEILLETDQYLVINKPAGINVERLPHGFPSVEEMVEIYLRGKGVKKPYAGIVHRLDRPVSGVLLVAKKKSVLKMLNEQFRLRKIRKAYQALVFPAPATEKGTLHHWLVKDQKGKRAEAYQAPAEHAKEAFLEFERISISGAGEGLLKVVPSGGQFHQIRVQLAAAGWPILGDEKYGSVKPFHQDAIALHATGLVFEDPVTGRHAHVISVPAFAS
ncbi:MAG TPA: RluA family pseudouridine synthase [Flavilitoribacter sp.]|nr:RluA family pseudouridine synthase [Flavilitoribacter sp.]HMQ89276.1 RluA family pseudouridine synthase [Flavilitoribacter sp.]